MFAPSKTKGALAAGAAWSSPLVVIFISAFLSA